MAYLPHLVESSSDSFDSTVIFNPSTTERFFQPMSEDNANTEIPSPPKESPNAAHATAPRKTQNVEHRCAFPVLPAAHNFSVLGNPQKFAAYILSEFPSESNAIPTDTANCSSISRPTTTGTKLRRPYVNSAFLKTLLKKPENKVEAINTWASGVIFPNTVLPKPFDTDAVEHCELLYSTPSLLTLILPKYWTEEGVNDWLNNIGNILGEIHNMGDEAGRRCFDRRTASLGPTGAYMLRKPDIVLIDHVEHESEDSKLHPRLHWRQIYALVEFTTNGTNANTNLIQQITDKAACLFDVQHQRKFVCALAIIKTSGAESKPEFTFYVVDRSGMTYTKRGEINGSSCAIFLRIVFAFRFASTDALGWDASMKVDPETREVKSIDVTGLELGSKAISTRTFNVVKLLHSSPVLYSRGTRVWIVKDEKGAYYVLKDSWIVAEGSIPERQFIIDTTDIMISDKNRNYFQHILPSYCIGQDEVFSTATVRKDLDVDLSNMRHRRRIVTSAIGDPITSFRSKKEFVSVCLDIVNALEFLSTKARVIHSDISINNLMINRVWSYAPNNAPSELRRLASDISDKYPDIPSSNNHQQDNSASQSDSNKAIVLHTVQHTSDIAPAVGTVVGTQGTLEPIEATGMLIDYDFMRPADQATHQTSGTLPFMAIETLKPKTDTFKHRPGHDLESLLNTMLTICLYTVGPGGQLRTSTAGDTEITFNDWFTISHHLRLAKEKSITLEAFNYLVTPHLPHYWKDFSPYLQDLINATWKKAPYLTNPNEATHEAYRKILKEALSTYSAQEESLAPYAVISRRKRQLDDSQPTQSKRPRRGIFEAEAVVVSQNSVGTSVVFSIGEEADEEGGVDVEASLHD